MSLLVKVVHLAKHMTSVRASQVKCTVIFLQDGEIDLKLLTKVLAPEQEVKEVSELLVHIACELLANACPAVSGAPGEGATLPPR